MAFAGVLITALDYGIPLHADELGLPPGASPPRTLPVDVDVRPLAQPDPETYRIRPPSSGTPSTASQSSAQWSASSATVVPETDTAWKLRWRKPNGVAEAIASGPQPLASSRARDGNESAQLFASSKYPVRAAAQLEPVDPFEEPYPGKPVANQAPSRTAPGAADDLNSQIPSTPEVFPVPEPDGLQQKSLPAPTTSTPQEDPPPIPPAIPVPVAQSAQPSTPRSDVPNLRVYNGRDCDEQDKNCNTARSLVAAHKIANILLDITPSIPDATSTASDAPSRTWKDRAGRVLGEGKFTDYRNGLVHIIDANNETVKLAFNELSDDDVCFVTAWWRLPSECSLLEETYQPRNWLASTFTWKASALCHKPLYFEEVALERYGHSVGPVKQPFVSGAHFFGSLIALPYQMGIHPPNECQYALGYYRPGSCAPWLVPPLPVSLRGAAVAAGTYVGGIFIIP